MLISYLDFFFNGFSIVGCLFVCFFPVVYGFIQGKKIPKPVFAGKQIQELGIGTFSNIATVQQTATLYEALSIFVERRVSALPVVDKQGELNDLC